MIIIIIIIIIIIVIIIIIIFFFLSFPLYSTNTVIMRCVCNRNNNNNNNTIIIIIRITHKLCYFDDNIFTHSTSLSHHARHNLTLSQPFARTNSYLYSFVPHTISYWNKLNPTLVTCPSLSAFKHHLPQYCNLPA